MKTKLFNFILLGTLLFTGVVSAQGTFSTPLHTGGFEQKKSGSFVGQFLKAGLKALPVGIPGLAGFVIADKVVSSPQGFFSKLILPVNNKGDVKLEPQLRVGSSSTDLLNAALDNRAPVTVDLAGRNSNDAVALLADPSVCTPNVSIVNTNNSAFHFWSDENKNSADIVARQIRLSGGNPTSGSVLVSDKDGNASWGTVRVDANGVATYSYPVSPAANGC
jgi:hypothetical protein